MIYSNACGYAIRGISRLSMIDPEGYVLLNTLCEDTDLPKHFVAKIFQDLVRKGLLKSAKGRGGGFALARPSNQITLMQIVEAVDGAQGITTCVVGNAKCDSQQPCPLHDRWSPIREDIKTFLNKTSLAEMSETLLKKLELIGAPVPPPQGVRVQSP